MIACLVGTTAAACHAWQRHRRAAKKERSTREKKGKGREGKGANVRGQRCSERREKGAHAGGRLAGAVGRGAKLGCARVRCDVKQRKAWSGPAQNGPVRGRKEGSRRWEGGKGGASWDAKRAEPGRGERKRAGHILGLG